MTIKKALLLLMALMLISTGCVTQGDTVLGGVNEKTIFNESLGITQVPKELGSVYMVNFDRYTKVVAPNGKPIHIVVQNDIRQEQILRCRGILEHFLRDYPGSKFGENKGAIANRMADNDAILALMNGQDDGSNNVRVNAQPLYKNEIQVEGHSWYVNQNYDHRDAAFEEILHFVHDNGIGVDGPNTRPGAAPEFQKVIRVAQINGLSNKLWASDERMKDWIEELDKENSLSQEYLASVIDTYYGLWGAFDEREGGMWGFYAAKTRAQLKTKDPKGYDLMDNTFFHPYLTYNARIDGGFEGVFSLKFDDEIPYSHHSRYLKEITLLGSKDTGVRVNELNNDITGNLGVNTVIFSGDASEYEIKTQMGVTSVSDKVPDRDGINVLTQVEKLKFQDKEIIL